MHLALICFTNWWNGICFILLHLRRVLTYKWFGIKRWREEFSLPLPEINVRAIKYLTNLNPAVDYPRNDFPLCLLKGTRQWKRFYRSHQSHSFHRLRWRLNTCAVMVPWSDVNWNWCNKVTGLRDNTYYMRKNLRGSDWLASANAVFQRFNKRDSGSHKRINYVTCCQVRPIFLHPVLILCKQTCPIDASTPVNRVPSKNGANLKRLEISAAFRSNHYIRGFKIMPIRTNDET